MNTKAIITSSLLSLAIVSAAVNAESASFKATVKVTNIFSFDKVTDLSFGTVRAKADTTGAESAGLVLSAEPGGTLSPLSNATLANAALTAMGGEVSPASFTITGVAKNARLTVTPPTETDLIIEGNPDSAAKFVLSDFTYHITKGFTTGNVASGTILQADDGGNLDFNLGATLRTSSNDANGTTEDYTDGDYSGSFNIEVNY